MDNDSAASTADIQDALIDMDGTSTRLTYAQENIDVLNIDPLPPSLQSAPTQSTCLPAQVCRLTEESTKPQ